MSIATKMEGPPRPPDQVCGGTHTKPPRKTCEKSTEGARLRGVQDRRSGNVARAGAGARVLRRPGALRRADHPAGGTGRLPALRRAAAPQRLRTQAARGHDRGCGRGVRAALQPVLQPRGVPQARHAPVAALLGPAGLPRGGGDRGVRCGAHPGHDGRVESGPGHPGADGAAVGGLVADELCHQRGIHRAARAADAAAQDRGVAAFALGASGRLSERAG
jgi:hypothetical protein